MALTPVRASSSNPFRSFFNKPKVASSSQHGDAFELKSRPTSISDSARAPRGTGPVVGTVQADMPTAAPVDKQNQAELKQQRKREQDKDNLILAGMKMSKDKGVRSLAKLVEIEFPNYATMNGDAPDGSGKVARVPFDNALEFACQIGDIALRATNHEVVVDESESNEVAGNESEGDEVVEPAGFSQRAVNLLRNCLPRGRSSRHLPTMPLTGGLAQAEQSSVDDFSVSANDASGPNIFAAVRSKYNIQATSARISEQQNDAIQRTLLRQVNAIFPDRLGDDVINYTDNELGNAPSIEADDSFKFDPSITGDVPKGIEATAFYLEKLVVFFEIESPAPEDLLPLLKQVAKVHGRPIEGEEHRMDVEDGILAMNMKYFGGIDDRRSMRSRFLCAFADRLDFKQGDLMWDAAAEIQHQAADLQPFERAVITQLLVNAAEKFAQASVFPGDDVDKASRLFDGLTGILENFLTARADYATELANVADDSDVISDSDPESDPVSNSESASPVGAGSDPHSGSTPESTSTPSHATTGSQERLERQGGILISLLDLIANKHLAPALSSADQVANNARIDDLRTRLSAAEAARTEDAVTG